MCCLAIKVRNPPSLTSSFLYVPEGAVVIFDEAHNVESVCSESASFDLSAAQLGSCAEEVTRAKGICAEKMNGGGEQVMTTAAGATIDYQDLYTRLDIVKVSRRRCKPRSCTNHAYFDGRKLRSCYARKSSTQRHAHFSA